MDKLFRHHITFFSVILNVSIIVSVFFTFPVLFYHKSYFFHHIMFKIILKVFAKIVIEPNRLLARILTTYSGILERYYLVQHVPNYQRTRNGGFR